MDVQNSNGLSKVVNLSSSIMSLLIFIINRQVIFSLGIICALCNMLGGYIGSNLAIKQGSKITRPIIIVVLILLFLKVL